MNDFRVIADRVETEALRGEFTDAVMMRDYDRIAAMFTADGAWRMPDIPAGMYGREQIRAGGRRVPGFVDFLVQNTHAGLIEIDGDTATGRGTDGRSALNHAIYHDRYERTADGWKSAERTYETPLTGTAPGRDDH